MSQLDQDSVRNIIASLSVEAPEATSTSDTYEKPLHGWTCFHCGETFTTVGCAADHFGDHPTAIPGCLVKVSLGAERGLLTALRGSEVTLAKYMEEDTELHRAMHAMQSRHSLHLQNAEETGYARGLRAGVLESAVSAAPVTAKLIEWEPQGDTDWSESRYCFYISHDPLDQPDTPFTAAWGEGDSESFATLTEAKAWCQREIDRWVASAVAERHPA